MTTAIKRRRGTTAQHATFTGLEGELTIDTTKDTVVVHDGATAGGFPLAKESQATTNVAITGGTITGITDLAIADGGTGASTASDARTNLGVTATGADTTYAYRANNLSDLASASTARSNLGLGTAATSSTGDFLSSVNPNYTGTLTGGTGVVNLGSGQFYKDASGNIGVGTASPAVKFQVNGTSDATIGLSAGGTRYGQIYIDNTLAAIQALNGVPLAFSVPSSGTGYTERMRIDSSGNVGIGTSSPTQKLDVNGQIKMTQGLRIAPSASDLYSIDGALSFYGTTNGVYLNGTTTGFLGLRADGTGNSGASIQLNGASYAEPKIMAMFTNGSERMRIDSSGNLLVGTTSATARGTIRGSGTTSSTFSLACQSSAGTNHFLVRDDGYLIAEQTYNNTSASAANMFIASGGAIYRATSSLKYKKDVENSIHGLADVLKLRSVTYKGKSESDGDKVFGGLIAEEVDAAGLTEFVQYADDGTPDALAYGQMVSLAFKAIQEQQALIENLTTRLNALEGL